MQRQLAVFVKEPRLGRVKRRLSRDVGGGAAWTFYRRLVRGVVPPLARDARWRTWLATTPARWPGRERFWPLGCAALDQGTGDLGQRMWHIFRALPPGPAIIVGSDIPALTPSHVADGFDALRRADVVFGPATDGGYWLIGLSASARRHNPFHAVRWSTPHARADTERNLPRGFRVTYVALLSDVDDGAAYQRHRLAMQRARDQAIATHSISRSNSIGQEAMATKVRAGGSFGK